MRTVGNEGETGIVGWDGKLPEGVTELPESWIEGEKYCSSCGEECLPWPVRISSKEKLDYSHHYVCPGACTHYSDYFSTHNLLDDYLALRGCPTKPVMSKEEQIRHLRWINRLGFHMDQKFSQRGGWEWSTLLHNLVLLNEMSAKVKKDLGYVIPIFHLANYHV